MFNPIPRQFESPPKPRRSQPHRISPWIVHSILISILGLGFFGLWWALNSVAVRNASQYLVRDPEKQSGVGEVLPYLDLEPLTGAGSLLSLSDLQGRVTLLNFWGTWCRPCRQELPHLAALRQRVSGQKAFRLVAVSCPSVGQRDDWESLHDETASLLKRLDLNLPTHFDPDYTTLMNVSQLLNLRQPLFPTTLLLDRHGVIRAVWIGYRRGAETEMERHIDRLLGEVEKESKPKTPPREKK
jgi:thiol-disulfide isomerase/thioredoxin